MQNNNKWETLLKLGDETLLKTEKYSTDYLQLGFTTSDTKRLSIIAIDKDFKYLNSKDELEAYAPCHAILALAQLKAIEPFEQILSQIEVFNEDDYYRESASRYFEQVGVQKVTQLIEFFLNEEKNMYDRMLVTDALEYIAKEHIQTKEQIEEAYIIFLKTLSDEDDGLNAIVIDSLIELTKDKHIDLIREIFRTKPVDIFFAGDLEDIEIKAGVRTKRDTKAPNIMDMFGMSLFDDEDEDEEDDIIPYTSKQNKIGRNEPCPCGSGKKYKKCCLNK